MNAEAERLFDQHQHLAKKTVFKLFNGYKGIAKQHNIEPDDLFQYANLSLWQSCVKFDPNKGSFKSYAIKSMRGFILWKLRMETSLIKYTSNTNAYNSIQKFEMVSIDNRFNDDSGDDFDSFHEIIPSDVNIEELAESNMRIKKMLSPLTDEELQLVNLKMEGYTNDSIGKKLGLTRQGVSARLNKIKKAIRNGKSTVEIKKEINDGRSSNSRGSRKMMVNGKIYTKVVDIANDYNMKRAAVYVRLKSNSEQFKNWYYINN